MRKLIITLVILLSASALFAEIIPSSTNAYYHILDPIEVTSVRLQGMGGAGIGIVEGSDAVFSNPAGLASSGFDLTIPYVSITLYNPLDIYKSGLIDSVINGEDYVSTAMNFLDNLGVYNKLLRVDAGFSLNFLGLGIGVAVQDTVLTYSLGSTVSSSVLDQLVVRATAGYGLRIRLPLEFSVDLGVSVSLNYIAFTEAIGASQILSNYEDILEYAKSSLPIMMGYSIPVTVGLKVNMPFALSIGAVLGNIHGDYTMKAYDGYEPLVNDVMALNLLGDGEYTIKTDMDLALGLSWAPGWRLLKLTVVVDLVDVLGLMDESVTTRAILGHLRIGAEVGLLASIVTLRAGLREGYATIGAGIDLRLFSVDVAYFNEEYGSTYGSKPVDGLSVRFRIGI